MPTQCVGTACFCRNDSISLSCEQYSQHFISFCLIKIRRKEFILSLDNIYTNQNHSIGNIKLIELYELPKTLDTVPGSPI